MATIKGIKLLHKRYTYDEWVNGTGLAVKPSLSFGEFGIATDKNEVRCNTHTNGEIAFTAATLVSFPKYSSQTGSTTATYISDVIFDDDASKGSSLTVVKSALPTLELVHDGTSSGAFIVGLELDSTNKHKLIYKLGDAPASTITITGTAAATEPTTETVDVVTKISDGGSSGHNHKIAYETLKIPTKKYVDDKVAGAGIELVESGKNASSNVVTAISAENIDGVHTITATYGQIVIPESSGSVDAADTSVVDSVTINNHKLSGTTKAIVGSTTTSGNGEITVSADNGNIKIQLNDNNYALKSELSMAMVFKGTVGTGGTVESLPDASDNTVGDAYKVIVAGDYGTGDLADCDVGDLLVCRHVSGSSYEWIRIPAGDDTDDFVSAIEVGAGLAKTGSALAPTISHKDYSSAASVTANMAATTYGYAGKVITGINVDADGLGHITTTPSSLAVEMVSVEGAREIAQEEESITTVAGTGKIVVSDSAASGSNDHAYTITHATVTKDDNDAKTATATHGGTIKAVTGVTYDDTGHVSGVEATTFTLPSDTNNWRPVVVNGDVEHPLMSSNTSTAVLDLTSGTNVTISGNPTNGKITISTLGAATAAAQGFVKLGTDTKVAGEKVYLVGKNAAGGLAVQVPWTDTDQYKRETGTAGHYIITPEAGAEGGVTDANYGTREMRFCAIGRDHGGHVVAAEDIQVLDGNA